MCPNSCPSTASTSSLLNVDNNPLVTAILLPVNGEPYANAFGMDKQPLKYIEYDRYKY